MITIIRPSTMRIYAPKALVDRLREVTLPEEPNTQAMRRLLQRLQNLWEAGQAPAPPLAPPRGVRGETLYGRPDEPTTRIFGYWRQRQPSTWSNNDLWLWLLDWAANIPEDSLAPISITSPDELADWVWLNYGYQQVAIATLLDHLKTTMTAQTFRTLLGLAHRADLIELDREADEKAGKVAIAFPSEGDHSHSYTLSYGSARVLPRRSISYSQARLRLYQGVPETFLEEEVGLLYRGKLRAFLVPLHHPAMTLLEECCGAHHVGSLDASSSHEHEFYNQLRIALIQLGLEPERSNSVYKKLDPPPKQMILLKACDRTQIWLVRDWVWTQASLPDTALARSKKPAPV